MNDEQTIASGIARVEISDGMQPRVIVNGDIDFHTAPEITARVVELLGQGHKRVDIVLASVQFLDSTGISALLNGVRAAKEVGARLILVSPTPQLYRILEASGFGEYFEFEDLPRTVPPVVQPLLTPINWQVSEFSVPCHPELVADIRRRVAQVAASMPFTAAQMDDIKLAVGEAAANAYRHGCGSEKLGLIHVRVTGDTGGLTVEITDNGPGFDPDALCLPDPASLECGGRGILFMRLSMDEVSFERLDQGMLVRLVKRIVPAVTK